MERLRQGGNNSGSSSVLWN